MQNLYKESYIYIIEYNGMYKIGRSVNPNNRLKNLCLGDKAKIIFRKKLYDCYLSEKRLHDEFYMKKYSGEWFKLSKDDIELAKNISHGGILDI